MAETASPTIPLSAPRLRFEIHNVQQLDVADLGALLNALNRDYKRFSGRSLVIASLETGSIVAELVDAAHAVLPYVKDAMKVFDAAKSLWKFGEILRDAISNKKNQRIEPPEFSPVAQTIEHLFKVGEKYKCKVSLKVSDKEGQQVEATIEPIESMGTVARAKIAKAIKKQRKQSQQRRIDSSYAALVDFEKMSDDELFTEVIIKLVGGDDATSAIAQIAEHLEQRGRHDLAARIRGAVDRLGR